jgi:hypothetical protein
LTGTHARRPGRAGGPRRGLALSRPGPAPPLGGPAARRRAALRIALTLLGAVIAAGPVLADRTAAPAGGPPGAARPAPAAPAVPNALVPAAPASELTPVDIGVADPSTASGPRAAPPVRLRIPALRVDAPLDRLTRQPDGTLSTPPRWDVPGWYTGGPRPGEQGPAVIAGHVDSMAGPAVFFELRRLRSGDAVDVAERGGQVLHFVVADVRRVPKDRFPTALVYGPQPLPVLRLITCTGRFDQAAGSYRSNLVVSAYLNPIRPAR